MFTANISSVVDNLHNVETDPDMVNPDQINPDNEVNRVGESGSIIETILEHINGTEAIMSTHVSNSLSDQKRLVEFQNLVKEYSTEVTVVSKAVGISIKGLNELLHPQ